MEITFLGTSEAVPTAKRSQTAILLRYENEMILFDCGEGTQRQFRKAKINPCKLTKIIISHWHGDHILGLPGLLQTLAFNNYNKTLHIYGPVGTKKYFKALFDLFIFSGKIKIIIKEIKKEGVFEKNNFILSAFKLKHRCPCLGYVFKEKDKRKINKAMIKKLGLKGPIVGKLQKGKSIKFKGKTITPKDISYIKKGKKIGIILDTTITPNCYKIAKDADILVCEATLLHELKDKASKFKHLTATQTAQIAKKANAKKVYLVHISQRYEHSDQKILKEAKKKFKNSYLTQDLMRINI